MRGAAQVGPGEEVQGCPDSHMPGDRKSAVLLVLLCLLCSGLRPASLPLFPSARAAVLRSCDSQMQGFHCPCRDPRLHCAQAPWLLRKVCCKHSSTQTQNSCCIIATFTIAQHGHRVVDVLCQKTLGLGKPFQPFSPGDISAAFSTPKATQRLHLPRNSYLCCALSFSL